MGRALEKPCSGLCLWHLCHDLTWREILDKLESIAQSSGAPAHSWKERVLSQACSLRLGLGYGRLQPSAAVEIHPYSRALWLQAASACGWRHGLGTLHPGALPAAPAASPA